MKPQPELFNDHPANADASAQTTLPTGTTLRLGEPGAAGAKLSPAQKRFNSLLARIDKLKAQLADIQIMTDAHRSVYQATLAPLREQFRLRMRAMAIWLDERLQGKGMTPAQKRMAHDIFYGLCEGLAADGDEEMRALHDKRSPQSAQEKRRAAVADLHAQMEGVLGKKLDFDATHEHPDPLEALLKKAMGELGEEAQAQAAHPPRISTAAARAAEKAQQQQDDADTILRKVYRQLASALHPDRERNPAEHKRKTALMSEANAAYGKQDLVALLHIQLRIDQASPQSLSQLPGEQIKSMSLLLKQQAGELQDELLGRQRALMHEFCLSPYDTLSAASLRRQLLIDEHMLKQDLSTMEQDLELVKYDQGFKDWLKMQTKLMKQSQSSDYF